MIPPPNPLPPEYFIHAQALQTHIGDLNHWVVAAMAEIKQLQAEVQELRKYLRGE